jgi:hypothetical protein
MRKDLTIRTVRTASGATAVQVVRNKGKGRSFLKHFGSAHTSQDLERLLAEARLYVQTHCRQPDLFAGTPPSSPEP